jgi:hypothetical protein
MFFGTIGFVAGRGGFPAAGTLLSTFCDSASGYDANNTYYSGSWTAVGNYADGLGGSYSATIGNNTLGCYYPSGWLLSYNYGDLTLQWSHGTDSGYFTYGSYNNGTAADGVGGSYSFNNSSVSATDNQIVHSDESYDYVNNWYVNEVLYFDLETVSLVSASWPFAGTILSSDCTTNSYTDAGGGTWLVGVRQEQIADGVGGYSYTNTPNTGDCGYWPSGYYLSYLNTLEVLYYYDYDSNYLSFGYANSTTYDQADGYGGSTSGGSLDYLYSAGHIFYSYYDEVGFQTVNYRFDGVNSYYIDYTY